MKQSNPNSRLKKPLIICTSLLAAGLLVYAIRVPILIGVAKFLTINDPLETADIIFVLGGGYDTRPFHAVELFEQGLAPKIVISDEPKSPLVQMGLRPSTTDIVLSLFTMYGIDETDVVLLTQSGGATSTREEALLLRAYAEEHALERIIVVTTAFHTRRARWIINRELADLDVDIRMAPARHQKFDETNWWRVEAGLTAYVNEYLKFAYYLYKY